MPYIAQQFRSELDPILIELVTKVKDIAPKEEDAVGVLNYCVTSILVHALIGDDVRYHKINSVNGVLTSVMQEIQERLTRPYEDQKIAENGDIAAFDGL